MTIPDVLEAAKPWMQQCGSCDAGLPVDCSCPPGDPRVVISCMYAEIESLRAAVAASHADALERIAFEVVGVHAADVHPGERLRFGEIRAALTPSAGGSR